MAQDQTENLQKFAIEAGVMDQTTAAQATQAQKPVVIIPGGDVSISKSAGELFGHIAKTQQLFILGGVVCQLTTENDLPVLEVLSKATACSRFEDFVQFVKKKEPKDGKVTTAPTTISITLADQYLQTNARKRLPEIRGIINCPIIVELNGKIHLVNRGYDPVTKLLIAKDVALPEVSLNSAIEMLNLLLEDFHFQTPGDRSRAIASFLTPALKFGGFIKKSIPADVAEANESQSGKTYRQQMIAALYNDKCNVVVKPETQGVGSYDEKFYTALVQGRPFIQFDNVRGKMKLQALESFMTADGMFSARAAYGKAVNIDPSRYMIMISSNGFEALPDLANRSSIIRIFKRQGHNFKPWVNAGEHRGGMLEFIRDYQPLLLSYVFQIIAEWHRQGKPRTNETRHDFKEWCQVCDWIVQNIFKMAPLMDGHEEAQKRTSNPDYTFLRNVTLAANSTERLGIELRASDIVELCEEKSINIPSISNDKRHDETACMKVIGKVMSRIFDKSETVEVETFTVTRKKSRSGQGAESFESKAYVFLKSGEDVSSQKEPAAPSSPWQHPPSVQKGRPRSPRREEA